MDERRISVVIPVRNEPGKIEHCLSAVLSQSLNCCEVILVERHPSDKMVGNASRFSVKMLYESYHDRVGGCKVGAERPKVSMSPSWM
jgi:cellulose synthase/poly-beta-1,6-N-acetylglucosamine synthase-like glycosyltransferase